MTHYDLRDAINVYSLFTFSDGRKLPGMLISRYNIKQACVDYYFVPQENLQAYKTAFEQYDREKCMDLIDPVSPSDLMSISPVSLSDFKSIMQQLNTAESKRQSR